ncbi:MAG: tetratricopeptide repeat protein [Candidatus Delongbacteria bacterium]|nr:tetratricopeptide repeat protein [Candidatus Delongbacteria bacterium]
MKRKLLTLIIMGVLIFSLIAKDSQEAKTAKVFYDNKDYDNAIDWYKKAVEKDENNSDLYLWLAKSYLADINNVNFMSKGLYSSKIKKYLKLSIKKDTKNIDAIYYLASFYFNAPYIAGGDKDKAWELTEKVAKLSPVKGHEIKAQFYSQEKEYGKAFAEYDELIKLDPNNAHTYYSIGIMHQQTKDYDKALSNFEKALSIDPKALESLYQVGRNAVFSKKSLDKGIEALTEYLKYKPEHPLPSLDGAYWRLAQIYQLKGDKNKAKESIAKAIKINPDDEYKKLLKEL